MPGQAVKGGKGLPGTFSVTFRTKDKLPTVDCQISDETMMKGLAPGQTVRVLAMMGRNLPQDQVFCALGIIMPPSSAKGK
jgi:hypothetical protein